LNNNGSLSKKISGKLTKMIPIFTSSLVAFSPANVDFQEELTTINKNTPVVEETMDITENNQKIPLLSQDLEYDLGHLPFQNLHISESSSWTVAQTTNTNSPTVLTIDDETVRLVATERGGEQYQFDFNKNSDSFQVAQETDDENPTIISDDLANVVEIVADEQEFSDQDNVVTARGNVVIRFANGVLSADQVSVNLDTRIAVAQGDVSLVR